MGSAGLSQAGECQNNFFIDFDDHILIFLSPGLPLYTPTPSTHSLSHPTSKTMLSPESDVRDLEAHEVGFGCVSAHVKAQDDPTT